MEQERRREAEEERRWWWWGDGGKRNERGVVVVVIVEEKVGREGDDGSVGFLRREDAIGDDVRRMVNLKRERDESLNVAAAATWFSSICSFVSLFSLL